MPFLREGVGELRMSSISRIEWKRAADLRQASILRELRNALRCLTAASDIANDPTFTETISDLRTPIAETVHELERGTDGV